MRTHAKSGSYRNINNSTTHPEGSAECRVESAEWRVQSGECRVQSAECKVQSGELKEEEKNRIGDMFE